MLHHWFAIIDSSQVIYSSQKHRQKWIVKYDFIRVELGIIFCEKSEYIKPFNRKIKIPARYSFYALSLRYLQLYDNYDLLYLLVGLLRRMINW